MISGAANLLQVADNLAALTAESGPVWTRVFCHSSLSFVVPIGILHINENWGGRMTKFPRLRPLPDTVVAAFEHA
jgi:hypothetical protein